MRCDAPESGVFIPLAVRFFNLTYGAVSALPASSRHMYVRLAVYAGNTASGEW
jgi:hypothetical protein